MSRSKLFSLAACFIVASAGALIAEETAAPATPAPAAETTVKGTMECLKCALKEAKECQNVLVVKDGDKSTTYIMDGKVSKDAHKTVCAAPKEGVSVTGTVSEKDGKKHIEVTKID